ncbi:Hypothetical predicted protein [Octopus vulgaris]|uniref:Uncharacterized protein n=1 Tax=Octopus vulgaris TaxID=6645 RepID=A0AA36F1X2_OCTVU|nr:Hypothetical predicted protein [Octopus vulgaris]
MSTVSAATEPMLRDERNAVCFGYDLLSIGALRGKMINQFIRILLPYTGYGAFEIVALPYCPQTFSIPLTPIHSETKLNVTNTAKNVSNLEAVISKMSQTIQSKLDLNNRSTDHFNVVIYFDSSVNIITPNIIEEIELSIGIADRLRLLTELFPVGEVDKHLSAKMNGTVSLSFNERSITTNQISAWKWRTVIFCSIEPVESIMMASVILYAYDSQVNSESMLE